MDEHPEERRWTIVPLIPQPLAADAHDVDFVEGSGYRVKTGSENR